MGRHEVCQFRQHRERRLRRLGAGQDRAEFAQKQHLGDLSRLIGLLPEPDALRVAAAENLGHNLPQVSCGEDFTLLQK